MLGDDPDATKEPINALDRQMARYESKLNKLMRLPAGQRVRWFAA